MKIGATYIGNKACEFVVWAPARKNVSIKILASEERVLPMTKGANGYWLVTAVDVAPGASYLFRLDDTLERPDPASNFQPAGVHGPSQVVDHGAFKWQDEHWSGRPLAEMIPYELHVGAFTSGGAFASIIPRLDDLKDLGVNTIELMPVAQFPGKRNWGYDGVYPYAVQNSYGGPDGLKRLVDACHQRGISVILDVVYNHLGPEGNYLPDFGPYFTEKYRTPWGEAINFDDAHSDEVRNFFIENALFWFENYHIDALRLDAIHAIFDFSAKHILQELVEKVDAFSKQKGRTFYLIAESDLNDSRIIRPAEVGGYGIHAQWSDDFHHSLRTMLTKERGGYYMDFGQLKDLEQAFKQAYVYDWQYSRYRKRRHGNDASDRPASQFMVYCQNHDQVGNRMLGDRLSTLVSPEALKLAAGAVLLSPYIPMLFMGEEYGEEAPFLYFVDHGDPDLLEAVRQGRNAEFRSFEWHGEPPDPASEETFQKSKLTWDWQNEEKQNALREFYRELIHCRQNIPALANLDNKKVEIISQEKERLLLIRRWHDNSQVFYALNFNDSNSSFQFSHKNEWEKKIDSADEKWFGPGADLPEKITTGADLIIGPLSVALYEAV